MFAGLARPRRVFRSLGLLRRFSKQKIYQNSAQRLLLLHRPQHRHSPEQKQQPQRTQTTNTHPPQHSSGEEPKRKQRSEREREREKKAKTKAKEQKKKRKEKSHTLTHTPFKSYTPKKWQRPTVRVKSLGVVSEFVSEFVCCGGWGWGSE